MKNSLPQASSDFEYSISLENPIVLSIIIVTLIVVIIFVVKKSRKRN